MSAVRTRTKVIRKRGSSRGSRNGPGAIHTVGTVPFRSTVAQPFASSLSVLLTSPSRAWLSRHGPGWAGAPPVPWRRPSNTRGRGSPGQATSRAADQPKSRGTACAHVSPGAAGGPGPPRPPRRIPSIAYDRHIRYPVSGCNASGDGFGQTYDTAGWRCSAFIVSMTVQHDLPG